MEIESDDGDVIPIERDSLIELGRRVGLGFRRPSSADRTVSRHHISLRLAGGDTDNARSGDELLVSFEVVGRNPIFVCSSECGEMTRVFRNSEKGELRDGDRFSLSIKNPSFWGVKRRGAGEGLVEQRVLNAVERRERRTLERKEKERMAKLESSGGEEVEEADDGELELKLGALDVSQVDPVKEFGFLVEGHEFDHYPKHKIRSPKEWNWFLEERRGNSDDDELSDEGTSLKTNRRRKNIKIDDSEDEDWTGESFDGKEIAEVGSIRKPKYSTRSKDSKRLRKDDLSSAKKPDKEQKDEKEEEDDEEDETLGGFIVNDADDEGESEEEEEEEFDDDEDDD
ncbi:hypothetical protein Cni_G02563 [Canna indica]|uniref:SMAD/FHA domain-containing protein n=1 Tax=Canna indica TaxID=4628 RepID=A0AAQ3Q2U4_9LILI|nr:hypothetical protein Cni_G02563 [Canna indica]